LSPCVLTTFHPVPVRAYLGFLEAGKDSCRVQWIYDASHATGNETHNKLSRLRDIAAQVVAQINPTGFCRILRPGTQDRTTRGLHADIVSTAVQPDTIRKRPFPAGTNVHSWLEMQPGHGVRGDPLPVQHRGTFAIAARTTVHALPHLSLPSTLSPTGIRFGAIQGYARAPTQPGCVCQAARISQTVRASKIGARARIG